MSNVWELWHILWNGTLSGVLEDLVSVKKYNPY